MATKEKIRESRDVPVVVADPSAVRDSTPFERTPRGRLVELLRKQYPLYSGERHIEMADLIHRIHGDLIREQVYQEQRDSMTTSEV